MKTDLRFLLLDRTIVLRHDAGLGRQATFLQSAFCEAAQEGFPVRAGARLQFGWSLLTLVERAQELVAHEPDFDGDPLTDLREDVSTTLVVQAMQSAILRKVLAQPERPALFHQRVVVACSVAHEHEVYCLRQSPTGKDDSGWYVGVANQDQSPEEMRSMRMFELLRTRLVLLSVMMLPVGYMAIISGQDIRAIVDPNDRDVWNSP